MRRAFVISSLVAALGLITLGAPAARAQEGFGRVKIESLPDPAAAPAAPPGGADVSGVTVTAQKPISKRREVDLDAVTCHDELPPGTRFKIKVCATNRQFLERTREQQELVREWQATPVTVRAK
ncbi:MAG TPA: hypothetical protein VFE18_08995 [Phenylobacterium sp.]|jgi:hypothetical protein|uniref:hypothetical protein n=1 Tax=Phenylobacterium sp. TaxID=1871053 RepID=UPI002D4846F6|nr:hypothetical protein [Phenylobacterium sp.]HZZ68297.1 hypothetical protein [Phenylobacterium sp.]